MYSEDEIVEMQNVGIFKILLNRESFHKKFRETIGHLD